MKLIISIIVICVTLGGSIAGAYALSLHALEQSNHRWCATLTLIQNARPPHAKTFQARYFSDLERLAHDFGCD